MPVFASLCESVTRNADTTFHYEIHLLYSLALLNLKYVELETTDFSNKQQATALPGHGSRRVHSRSELIKPLCCLFRTDLLF